MNQFYNIWNYDYIQQQAQAEHHFFAGQAGTGHSEGTV